MFTYLNPKIRQKLIKNGKLIRIDAQGQNIDPDVPTESGSLSLNIIGPIPLPLNIGNTKLQVLWYAAVRTTELYQVESLANQLRETGEQNLFSELASSMAVNSVLIVGDPHKSESPLVRVHSSCLTGDVFYSQRCECGPQLAHAADRMNEEDSGGYLVYMAGHEGRGIGLWAKAATYLLQDEGESTYQANKSLGLDEDCRDFRDAAALLHYFVGDRPSHA
ncbi:MAG: GTP cyclohydrolase II [Halieaceae bacterium]|nr:GTP cyclohydrolase II [Halieaceae bacterium]